MFRRNRVKHLDDEIRFHVEREIAENVARGLTAEEAHNAALRAFGGIEQHKEECRDARRVRFIEELRQNLRFAWRRLRSSPGLGLCRDRARPRNWRQHRSFHGR